MSAEAYYDLSAQILLRVNEGDNPTLLAEYVIPALEGGQLTRPDGIKQHSIDASYISYGLVLALADRIRSGDKEEREYIEAQLHELIGELDK